MNISTYSYGSTALHLASYNGRLEIAQLLLCQRADMSIRNVNGITAIGIASSRGHLKEIAVCLRNGQWLS